MFHSNKLPNLKKLSDIYVELGLETVLEQLRVPDNDSEYADRIKNINEDIQIFKTIGLVEVIL